MKMLVIIFSMLILGSVFTSAFAQSDNYPSADPTLDKVSLQLVLRNSDGKLITYVEPTMMSILDIDDTHNYLDSIQNKTIIAKDGENFELIQFQKTDTFATAQQIGTYQLIYNKTEFYQTPVLLFRHDGYFTHPGDVLTAYWSIIRAIDR